MKHVKSYGQYKIFEVQDKFLVRVPGDDNKPIWKVYAKYKDDKLKDFLFSARHVDQAMRMLAIFKEDYNVPIMESEYPAYRFNSDE